MIDSGFEVLGNILSPIIPIMMYNAHTSKEFAKELFNKGKLYINILSIMMIMIANLAVGELLNIC